jgi:hypothetical protein
MLQARARAAPRRGGARGARQDHRERLVEPARRLGRRRADDLGNDLYYQRAARALEEQPGAIEEGVHGAPDCPILSIDGVGSILMRAAATPAIGRVTRGEFARAVPTPFIRTRWG